MTEAPTAVPTQPGFRWKRLISMFIVCMIGVGVLAVGLIFGAIPVQFGISKVPFFISMDKLKGTSITAYVGNDAAVEKGDKAMIVAGVKGGEGENLCLSTTVPIPFIDDLELKITSGSSTAIPLDELRADGTHMGIGDVTVKDLELGGDAGSFTQNDLIQGPDGTFGVEMKNADVSKITLDGEKIKAGSLRLRGLGLGVKLGPLKLFDPQCEAKKAGK